MIICHCNVISDREVRSAIRALSARQFDAALVPADIHDWLERQPNCGKCAHHMTRMIDEARQARDAAHRADHGFVHQALAAE